MREVVIGVLASTAILSVGYLIYFDFKRRDPKFRRKIKRDKQAAKEEYEEKVGHLSLISQSVERAAKMTALSAASAASGGMQLSEQFLTDLENEPEPKTLEEKEKYFIKHLDIGEKLLTKGPSYFDHAAGCFFRVLSIYRTFI
jgi:import receptor subunit TOM20